MSEKDFYWFCFSLLTKKLVMLTWHEGVPVDQNQDEFSQVTNDRIVNRLNWLENEASVEGLVNCSSLILSGVKNTNETYPIRKAAKTVGIDVNNCFQVCEKVY